MIAKWCKRVLPFLVFFCALKVSAATSVTRVEDVIQMANEQSETLQSANKTIESIKSEIRGRDLVLGLKLDAEAADVNEHRDSIPDSSKFHTDLLTTTLSKLFSTGTAFTATAGESITDTAANGEQNIGMWQLKLTQSLWRDGFGRSTRLRHQSEESELHNRTLATLYQKQLYIVDLESTYWDLIFAKRQEEIRRDNIKKSETVEKWTSDRVRHSTSEPSDLLQSRALVSQRRLEYLTAESQITTLQNKLRQILPFAQPEFWGLSTKELELNRETDALLATNEGSDTPMRLDSLSSQFAASQSKFDSDRVYDSLRPKVDAYVMYGQDGEDARFANSWERSADPLHNQTRIGVLLSMDLDWDLKHEQRRAARLAAQAKELDARGQARSSMVGWSDLNRLITDLKRQAAEAEKLTDLQERKVAAERSRFRLGRTTVFQLIQFEIDSANAEISESQILVNLRKAEGRARLYARLSSADANSGDIK